MGFEKKTWVDRLSEFAGRRLLTIISKSDSQMVVDVTRAEGNVSRPGDAFSAANMNDLEQRIADEFEEVNNDLAQQPEFVYDATGKITGYKTPGGADTVFPFRGDNFLVISSGKSATSESNLDSSFTITKAGLLIVATYNLLYPSTAVTKNGAALNALKTIENSVYLKIFASEVKAGDTIRVYSYYNNAVGNFRGAGFIAGLV